MRRNSKKRILAQGIIEDISNGLRPVGTKLPSLRQFAKEYGISKSSAVEIYERLIAEEVIDVRGTAGFFVKGSKKASLPPDPSQETEINWRAAFTRSRQPSMTYQPNGGWLERDLLPLEGLRLALREASRASPADLLDYGDPLGHLPLRVLLVERLARLGIEAWTNGLLITDSASMALDLLCRWKLKPGDRVLMDDPTSFDFTGLAKLHGVDVLGIPFVDGKRDLALLRRLVEEQRPAMYLIASAPQNPTGHVLSPPEAFELLSILRSAGVFIVEDDVYSDLESKPSVRLAALAGLDGIAYIGGFSKVVSGGLRCGYVCAEPEIISELGHVLTMASFGLNTMTSLVIYKLLTSGVYRRNVDAMRGIIRGRRTEAMEQLRHLGFEIPLEPEGGIFIWARWPHAFDLDRTMKAALSRRLSLSPGTAFSPSGGFAEYFRFNCTLMHGEHFYDRLRDVFNGGGPPAH